MASACAGTGIGNSTSAVDVMYNRGDAVWYRQRDGSEVPAKVGQPFVRLTKLLFPACILPALHSCWSSRSCNAMLLSQPRTFLFQHLFALSCDPQMLYCCLGCGS